MPLRRQPNKTSIFIFTGEFGRKVRGVGTSSNHLFDALSGRYKVFVIEDPTPMRSTPMYLLYESRISNPKSVSLQDVFDLMNPGDQAIFEYATFAETARSLPKGVRSYYRAHGVVPLRLRETMAVDPSEVRAARWCARKQQEMADAVDVVLALGDYNESMCRRAFHSRDFCTLHNSIDLVEWERKGVLFLGACTPSKGATDLLRAAMLMPDIPFTMIGTADNTIVQECNSMPNVNYRSSVSDKFEVSNQLRRHRVLAVPSYFDGIPYVIVEAMREMTPVAAYPFEGVEDMGLHPACISKSKTPESITETIRNLYDRNDLDDIVEHNLRSMLDRYTKSNQLAQVEKIIKGNR